MTRLDAVFAVFALIAFAIYMAVLIWKVPSPDLIVVSVIGVGLAAFDFARSFRRRDGRKSIPTDTRS